MTDAFEWSFTFDLLFIHSFVKNHQKLRLKHVTLITDVFFFGIPYLFTHPSNLNPAKRDENVGKKKSGFISFLVFNSAFFFADYKELKRLEKPLSVHFKFSLHAMLTTVTMVMTAEN